MTRLGKSPAFRKLTPAMLTNGANLPMTRRRMLAVIGAGAVAGLAGLASLAGCKPSNRDNAATGSGGAGATTTTKPDAGAAAADTVVRRAADNERALIAAYDGAASAHPDLAARLQTLRADHVRHLEGLVPGASHTLPATTTPTPTPTLTPSAPPVSATEPPRSALTGLATLEHAAAAARVSDAVATSGSLARLLASIGGCEAAHESLLRAST